jgi:hypothetical protein
MRPAPIRLLSLLALVALLPAGPALAGKIQITDEAVLNVNLLLQPQVQLIKDGAPVGDVGTDLFLRRARILVFGSVTKHLSFFVETDQPNFGKDGNFDVAFYLQDAFLSYEVADKIFVDAVDYHSNLVRFTPGVGKVWRDTGVQLRGFAGPVGFRAAILNGVEGKKTTDGVTVNPDDLPRGVASVRWNFLTREEDLFFQGIYFDDKPRLSVGLGADYQPSAVATASGVHDSANFATDVFLDLPLAGDQAVVFNTGVYTYRQGMDAPQSGTGFFSEVGYRFGQLEPVVSAEYFNSRVNNQDLLVLRPGFNIWFQKHTFNLKTEVAVSKLGDISEADTGITGTAQLQLFY